jgi:HEPN domain-containing protein
MQKADLKKIIKNIDEDLIKEQVPLELRPMQALLALSQRLKLKITSLPDDETHKVVINWFSRKYGASLKRDHNLGVMAILIRSDLFKMTLPLVYGEVQVVVDPNVELRNRVQKSVGQDPAVVYVLNCIEGLSNAHARELSPVELKELLLYYSWGAGAFQSIALFSGNPYTREALKDLRSAVEHLFGDPRACGRSKWASLQAAEKLLRAYIAHRGGVMDRDHDLLQLARDAYALGLPALNPDNLEILKCDPGVLSGKTAVDVQQAVEAHHASIDICAIVASSARRHFAGGGPA